MKKLFPMLAFGLAFPLAGSAAIGAHGTTNIFGNEALGRSIHAAMFGGDENARGGVSYCTEIDFATDVEPICLVRFAGIDNPSCSEVDCASALEDFTGLTPGEVNAGETYTITVAGNTAGNFVNHFRAFFDWDQDGTFESSTVIGTVTGDVCETEISADVHVPPSAAGGLTRMRVVKNYNTSPADPCAVYYYGQAEDYMLDVTAALACSGAPAPGATISSAASICAGIDLDLSLENAVDAPGISYQWQSSTDDGATWTDGATTATWTLSITEATSFQCIVTCASGSSTTSTPVAVTVNAVTDCYCTPVYGNAMEPICSVRFAGIDNASCDAVGCDAHYVDYSALAPAEVEAGGIYPIVVSGNTDGAYTNSFVVFFDWDQDGVFDANTVIGTINGSACDDEITADVTVPLSALEGTTRFRVVKTYGGTAATSACGPFGFGQAEDYSVTVSPFAGCITPEPGAAVSSVESACSGIPFNLSLENPTAGAGISHQWQFSTDDGATWEDGATTETWATSLTATTIYRCQVTCAGGATLTSGPITVTIDAGANCCTVSYAFDVEPICLVQFAGIDNESCSDVNCGPATEDFTALAPAEVQAGESYPIVVSGNTAGNYTNWFVAFFDWDQDGTYESATTIGSILNTNCELQATGSIQVPPTALGGTTRMRVIKNYNTAATDPCGSYNYGQAEDYLVTVTPADGCVGTPAPGAALSTAADVCADIDFTLSLENSFPFPDISYQWEYSTDGGATWTSGVTTATWTLSITEATIFRCHVVCGKATGTSTSVSVALNDPMDCYCGTIDFANDVEPICSVLFAGIDNTSCSDVDCGPALEDFTSGEAATVARGGTYAISLTGNTAGSYTNYFTVFFDWDQDGEFETLYEIGSITGNVCTEVLTGNIAVPPTALLGTTRMRVVKNFNTSPTDPCGTYSYGQAEDYLVTVTIQDGMASLDAATLNIFPNPNNGQFNVRYHGASGQVRLDMMDMAGRLISSTRQNMTTGEVVVVGGVGSLAAGTYMVRLVNADGQVTKLVAVE